MNPVRHAVSLIIGACAVLAAHAPTARAQSPATAAEDELEEVTVTSTRQIDTVNRVPLSVTAQTQKALDQQGIQDISDLEAVVPGMRLSGREASGNVTVAIRGLGQQSATAATTGFYLDETPLSKRAAGGFGSQNGTPVPPLFDMERVEVLRGPQGTLFGGGSEGGTIRYIQPAPGLTDYSTYGRAQLLTTKDGDPTVEAGVAVGGPIVEDKLGFRASVFSRKTGGYIDLTDYRDGEVYDKNANSGKLFLGRVAVAWAPTDSTRLTLSYLKSTDKTDHLGNSYNLSEPGQLQIAPMCFNVPAILSHPVADRAFLFPFRDVFPVMPGCDGTNGTYIAPGYTVGPFDLDRFQSLALGRTPTRTELDIGSVDFRWDITDDLQLKSITSYTVDTSRGQSPQNFPLTLLFYPPGLASIVTPGLPSVAVPRGSSFNPNITSTPDGLGLGALIRTNTDNHRNALSQEFRLASAPDQRVSFVVGTFFSNTRAWVKQLAETTDEGFRQWAGMGVEERYGVPFTGFFSNISEFTRDVESAAFGDVTVRMNERWRASAGLRVTYITTTFEQSNYGPNGGTSSAAQSQVSGRISETPITPKASLQYFMTPDDLLYASAAKGFRAGGVNQVTTSATDGLLALFDLTAAEAFPRTFKSDSVWNYELGAKFRVWDGKAQINTAVYDIEWKDVQTFYFTGDGAVFNVPSARSRGAELETQVRPLRPLTLNGAVAYTKSKYTSGLSVPGGPGSFNGDLVVATKGQVFQQPEWTVDLGARYDFMLGDSINAYARIDYRWFEGYPTAVPGTSQYSPDSSDVPSQKNINLRLGFEFAGFDVNLFALNVTDEKKGQRFGGRSECAATSPDCSEYNAYGYGRGVAAPVPRQIGIQVAYRR